MSKILTFGVYDYFHLGHLRLFKQCKAYADYLIVAVQDGNYIKKFKPDAKVLYTTEERVEMLEALRIVDKVVGAFLPDSYKIKQDIPIPRICKSCYKIPKNLLQELRHLATSFQSLSTFFLICVSIF